MKRIYIVLTALALCLFTSCNKETPGKGDEPVPSRTMLVTNYIVVGGYSIPEFLNIGMDYAIGEDKTGHKDFVLDDFKTYSDADTVAIITEALGDFNENYRYALIPVLMDVAVDHVFDISVSLEAKKGEDLPDNGIFGFRCPFYGLASVMEFDNKPSETFGTERKGFSSVFLVNSVAGSGVKIKDEFPGFLIDWIKGYSLLTLKGNVNTGSENIGVTIVY